MPHLIEAVDKAARTVAAVTRLMAKTKAPSTEKRRLLASVAKSVLLYAAPVWIRVFKTKKAVSLVGRLQRRLAIAVACSYRTVSGDAIGVIAALPPLDLVATEAVERANGVPTNLIKINLMQSWQLRWDAAQSGRWTRRLIPRLEPWVYRKHGQLSYELTQFLSGHGCFNHYLHRMRRRQRPTCAYCINEDTAEHTLFECCRWEEVRGAFNEQLGRVVTAENIVECMLESQGSWDIVKTLIKNNENQGC